MQPSGSTRDGLGRSVHHPRAFDELAQVRRRREFAVPHAREVTARMGHTASAQSVPCSGQLAFDHLERLGPRQFGGDPHERRPLLRSQVRLLGQELAEGVDVEGGVVRQHQRRHHLIADIGGRYPVYGDFDHVRVTQQHPLDRRRAEVFAVDAHPVAKPPREVRVAVLVAVREVAAVVHAAGHPFGVGLGIVVVALEPSRPSGVHQLARDAGRAWLAGVHVDDLGAVGQRTQRSRRGVRCPPDRHSAFGGTESVDDDGVESAREPVDVGWAHPRFRTPPSAGCRRRRDAPEWRAHTTAACRHSSRRSRRSGGCREGTAMQRTCAATPSSLGTPVTPPSRPAPRSSGTTASTHSRRRRARVRIGLSSSRRRSRPCRGCRSPPWGRHWYRTYRSA